MTMTLTIDYYCVWEYDNDNTDNTTMTGARGDALVWT